MFSFVHNRVHVIYCTFYMQKLTICLTVTIYAGNRFTSLEGVEFNWQISTVGTIKNMSILRFLTFKESMYETPSSISTFEDKNKRGHIVLLEGIKTGSAKVQVQLPYEEYVHVNVCEVQLFVMANLLIIPAEVYVMPGDVVMFKLFSVGARPYFGILLFTPSFVDEQWENGRAVF